MTSDTMKQFNGKADEADQSSADAGKAVLVGLLGGLVSAAGYLVYQRLPDEQKRRIQVQVRGIIETRLNQIRQDLNI
ncbi:MAG TPA: hypothetical protein VGG22_11765 [Candidatus Baltobacteraceae bacterium]